MAWSASGFFFRRFSRARSLSDGGAVAGQRLAGAYIYDGRSADRGELSHRPPAQLAFRTEAIIADG